MSTIITIAAGDNISDSRTDINTNFTNLNSDKVETSVLDTDTTLAANSDSKVATQKAVKTYIDTSGGANASTTVRGIVEEATQAEVDAETAVGGTGARLFINPSTPQRGVTKSITAGATITGATTPVPVYQNKTDNEFYACDANDTNAYKFLGFAISNGTNGNSMTVKFTGIVSGFTALDEGEKYYVQDAVGTIGTTPGTQEILVGIAISTTELLIQKGRRHAAGAINIGSATTTTTLTIGFRPTVIRLTALGGGTSDTTSVAHGVYTNGALTAAYEAGYSTSSVSGEEMRITDVNGMTNYMVITVGNITDTAFDITYTETGTYSDGGRIVWEADGEL